MRLIHWALVSTAIVVLASLTSLLRNAQSCACEQTYMYTSYTEIPMLDPLWSKHRYKLQLYRETTYATQALPPSGLPALLIPGNAGSYEQVRSLAGESARLAARARKAGASIPDLDWYTLDLRSELSAFDGQLLADQADFAIACLAQLKAMYSAHGITARSSTIDVSELPPNLMPRFEEPNVGASNIGASNSDGSSSGSSNDSKSSSSNREVSGNPAGIILVGHSMGGVVARAAAAAAWKHPDLGPGSITLLLTLASPHQAPPLLLQPDLARFYDSAAAAAALPDGLPVASVHGGTADMQVSPYLTRLPGASSSSSSSNISSMSVSSQTVPGAWLHAGHTQIDWCNQLATRLAAMLMEVHAQQHQQPQREEQRPEQMQQGGRKLKQQQQQQLVGSLQSPEQQQQQGEEDKDCCSNTGDVSLCDGQNSSVQLTGNSSISMTAAAAAAGHWLHKNTVPQCAKQRTQQQQQQQQDDPSGSVQVGVVSADDLIAAAAAKDSGELGKPVFLAAPQDGVVHAAAAAPAAAQLQRSLPFRHLFNAAHHSATDEDSVGLDEDSSDSSSTAAAAAARVAGTMQQFLTGRVLIALGFDSEVGSHSRRKRQQPHGIQAGAAGKSSKMQDGSSTQQQQRPHGHHRVHTRPGRSGNATATTAAAGPAAQGNFGQQRHHGTLADQQRQQQQELVLLAPLDVQLSVSGVCPAATTAAAAAAESKGPDWYVTDGNALEQHVSPGNMTFKVSPAAAAAAAAETGSGAKMAAAAAGQGGAVYYWKVPDSAADFTIVVSGAKPCSGFRVWVQQQQQQPGDVGDAAGHAAGSSVWCDVTGLAAPLPVLQDELVYEVRHYSRWLEVINGRDYLSHASWTLALTHKQHLPEHLSITRVAVWLAAAADPGSGSSSGLIPAAASLTAQWQPVWQQQQQHSSSSSRPVMHLSPLAVLRPLSRPAGGPMLIELQLHWRWLINGLSIRVQTLPDQHGSSSSSTKQGCWLPAAVYSSSWGGLEHVTVFNTTAAAASSSVGGFLAHLQQQWIQPWIRSRQKASSQPGASSSQSNSLLVSDVRSGDSVKILLDPTFSYSISLGWDLVDISAQILLSNLSAAAGIVVALLLLVLSHQMSSLLKIIAAAQNGTTTAAAAAQNGSSVVYAAATAAEVGSEHLPVVRSSFAPQRGSSSSSSEGGAEIALRLRLSSDSDQAGGNPGHSNSEHTSSGPSDVANHPGSSQATAAGVRSDPTAAAAAAAQKPTGGTISRLARASSSSSSYPPTAAGAADQSAEVGVNNQARSDHLGRWQQQQQQHEERDPDRKLSKPGGVRVGLRGLSRTALNTLRRQLLETLGGALPPIQQLTAAAAAKQSGSGSSSKLGISVYDSLVAVTSDARVSAAAVTLAAAAAALDRLNPNSLYYWGNTAHSSSGSSSSAMSLLSPVGWLLQQCMAMIGLRQRMDSPGVFGAALLLGVALLFLLVDVWLSVGVKLGLDWCAAAVKTFSSTHTPESATMADVAAASGASQKQHQGLPCSCALCTAADAACGGVCGVAAAAAGGFFGGSFCGLDTSTCCNYDRDVRDLHDQSAAASAAGSSSSTDGAPTGHTMTRDRAQQSGVHSSAAAAAAMPWWRQRKCQLQALGLLLLAAVHIALALAAAVLLLFSTWHLPSNSSTAAARVAELLLGSRANSRAASPVKPAPDHISPPAAAAAAPMTTQPGSVRSEAGIAATDGLDTNAVEATDLAITPAATASAGAELPDGVYRSKTASWGSLAPQNTHTLAAAAAGSAEQLQNSSSVLPKPPLQQPQQQRSDVRSGAGLAVADGNGSDLVSDPLKGLQVSRAKHSQQTLGHVNGQISRRSTERGVSEHESKSIDPNTAGESLHNAHLLDYRLSSSLEIGSAAAAAGDQDLSGHSSPLRAGRFAALLGAAANDDQQQQQQLWPAVAGQRALAKHGSFNYQQQQLLQQQQIQLQQQQPLLIQQQGRWSNEAGAAYSHGASPSSSMSMEQQRQLYYQQRPSIGGTPRASMRQQHGPDVVIVDVYDAAATRAVALHQLTCHMTHAWTLLYGCCCLMLLPSLVAWVKLPLGQQHMSCWRDVVLLLPVLLHCVAIAAGTIEAMVGSRPASTVAAAAAKHKSRVVGTSPADVHMQETGTRHIWARWFDRPKLASTDGAENDSLLVDTNEPNPGLATQSCVHPQPIDLHKLLIRCAAVYMFTAALIGQAVLWSCVVPAVACLLFAGHHAVDAWQTVHYWVHARLLQRVGVVKHKGT